MTLPLVKMRYLRLFIVFVLPGCAFTQQYLKPNGKLPSNRNQESLENERRTLKHERNKGAGDGSYVTIKDNPEHTKTYTNVAKNSFQGVNNLMDAQWMKRKQDHEHVMKQGDKSRNDNSMAVEKVEQSQYASMDSSFGKAKYDLDDMNRRLSPHQSPRNLPQQQPKHYTPQPPPPPPPQQVQPLTPTEVDLDEADESSEEEQVGETKK